MKDTITTVGRRKTAVARLILQETGETSFLVNKQKVDSYFPHITLRSNVYEPFGALERPPAYAVQVRVHGGGLHAQSDAIRLALSRALVELNPDDKPPLRSRGFLTRDSRMVERKKYGHKKARRRFQFSKR